MVDPNRKINRLTDKDIEFLEECEHEFSLRFTEDDPEFVAYCSKPLSDPPILENWNAGESGGHHNRNQWNWRGRAGYEKYRNERNSVAQYPRKRPAFNNEQTSSSPKIIRRDYINFVPASKDK